MFNFFTKVLLKSQLKHLPEEQVNKVIEMIEKNPAFFQKMAESIQEKMKSGMSQEEAAKSFLAENGEEAKQAFGSLGM